MIPIWRTGSWAGAFADPFIRDTELEGGIPSLSLHQTCQRFKELFQSEKLKFFLGNTTSTIDNENDKEILCVLANQFDNAAKLSDHIVSASKLKMDEDGNYQLESLVETILGSLAGLRVHEYAIVPGGWTKRTSAHAILFVIQRENDASVPLGLQVF